MILFIKSFKSITVSNVKKNNIALIHERLSKKKKQIAKAMRAITTNSAKVVNFAPNKLTTSLKLLGSFLTNKERSWYCLLLLIRTEKLFQQ